jgi:hypothetical protein
MEELVAIAKRLRNIRSARRKFLALWALEQDRKNSNLTRESKEKLFSDPMNHDWSLLYLGSVFG